MDMDEEKMGKLFDDLNNKMGSKNLKAIMDFMLDEIANTGEPQAVMLKRSNEIASLDSKIKDLIIRKNDDINAKKAVNLYEQIIKLFQDFIEELGKK